jgi:hypothetical protein
MDGEIFDEDIDDGDDGDQCCELWDPTSGRDGYPPTDYSLDPLYSEVSNSLLTMVDFVRLNS